MFRKNKDGQWLERVSIICRLLTVLRRAANSFLPSFIFSTQDTTGGGWHCCSLCPCLHTWLLHVPLSARYSNNMHVMDSQLERLFRLFSARVLDFPRPSYGTNQIWIMSKHASVTPLCFSCFCSRCWRRYQATSRSRMRRSTLLEVCCSPTP